MKKNTKKTRAGTLTAILLFVLLSIFLTTMSNGTVTSYYTENGFMQPESDIRWLPSLNKMNTNNNIVNENNVVNEVVSHEQMNVIHQIDDIKEHVKETHNGEPYFHILSEVDVMVGSAKEDNMEVVEEENGPEEGKISDSEFNKIVNLSPLVLFYESSHDMGLKVKNILLNEYDIYPEMTIVDLDKYFDKKYLLTHIKKQVYTNSKTSSHSTYLYLKGKPIVCDDLEDQFMELHQKNILMQKVHKLSLIHI